MRKAEVRMEPTPKELAELFDLARKLEGMLIIFARCRVHYEGRAKSELGEGDRIIMIKPDGSFLIHQKKKREPVNWQPPGSKVRLELRNVPTIVSVRRKPREILEVELLETYMVSAFFAEDYEALKLSGSEAEMAALIFSNPDVIEPGFKPLFREKPVRHGIVDVLGVDKEGNLVVLELKRRKADLHAVSQLKRYVEALREENPGKIVRGILVAPSITAGAQRLLEKEGLEFRRMEPPKRKEKRKSRQKTLDFL
ncbi:endonuclease NucS [Pyrococcus yayanosii]|uniref:Endonuclease NucS n=1 Tax=Pyrococcus yayanosii (strain CH1 / JCM 16557) TaxID=529709 RepID=F8AH49_PYRYC|nr:endonuclease NucS [Pyrococcus yayanosii]AEH25279.1 hypothetical protein PYCH_16130 [Pyrococcus yayanosii CH1]